MTLIGYIPARVGSKRLKNKNFIDFHEGKSITEIALKKSKNISRIKFTILDTNDQLFLEKMCNKNLSDYSLIRDESLASDNTSTLETLKNSILKFEKNLKVKVTQVALLQPTSPLISLKSINKVIDKFIYEKLDLVATYSLLPVEITDCLIKEQQEIKPLDNFKLSTKEEVVFDTGGVYLISKNRLFSDKDPFSIESIKNICMIPLDEFVDIDRYDQFQLAQRLYNEGNIFT